MYILQHINITESHSPSMGLVNIQQVTRNQKPSYKTKIFIRQKIKTKM